MKIESNIIFNSCLADVQNRDSIQSLELHDNVQKCAKPDRPAHQTSPPPKPMLLMLPTTYKYSMFLVTLMYYFFSQFTLFSKLCGSFAFGYWWHLF